MAFVADDHFAVVLQPCEQTLDDPAASIATKFSSVLRVALDSIAPMWRNQLDSSLGQSFVESVGRRSADVGRRGRVGRWCVLTGTSSTRWPSAAATRLRDRV